MKSIKGLGKLRAQFARFILASGIAATSGMVWAQGWQLADHLSLKTDLNLKETYDDNVFILDTKPDPTITPPTGVTISVPNKDSLVTTVIPGMALNYQPCTGFGAVLSYAPELTWYHSAHSEDHVSHRGAINFRGRIDEVTYEWLNSVTWIDGSHLSYITIRPGDCRCIGGIPLRDRREAAIYHNGLKVTIPAGKWFFRPVVKTYVHDFQTEQRPNVTPTLYIYDNFVDRWDVSGGLDVGFETFSKTKLVLGYRYGHQEQGKLLGVVSRYSNNYQRFLVGVEGTPISWLKLAVLAGPDIRDWCTSTPAGFDRNELLYWIDGIVTVLPTHADTVTFRATRYEQPAFTSQSMYEDIKYDLGWRHQFTDKFTAGAGVTLYIGDWQAPVNREDWIWTPNVTASYAFNAHLTGEVAWSYDLAESHVPTGPGAPYSEGRDFTRNLVSVGLKYTF
jgi:hypothetical protein